MKATCLPINVPSKGIKLNTMTLDASITPAHVAIQGVTRRFPGAGRHPEVHALGPIDLELRAGEFFSIVGPSGCGKSTLLDLIASLASPSDGVISFEGKRIGNGVPDGVGVVFQEDASFPWLTVWDNAAFGARRAGIPEAEVRARVDHALHFMGLKAFMHAYPLQLSGGMRQRVCIARALVLRPRLLLLDEPFGALDQQTRLLMGDEVMRLWRETGSTILLITHSLDEAAMLSDRIGVMSSRPGRFIEIIETNWPRERDSNVVSDPHFGELTARTWALLREESLKAMHVGVAA